MLQERQIASLTEACYRSWLREGASARSTMCGFQNAVEWVPVGVSGWLWITLCSLTGGRREAREDARQKQRLSARPGSKRQMPARNRKEDVDEMMVLQWCPEASRMRPGGGGGRAEGKAFRGKGWRQKWRLRIITVWGAVGKEPFLCKVRTLATFFWFLAASGF